MRLLRLQDNRFKSFPRRTGRESFHQELTGFIGNSRPSETATLSSRVATWAQRSLTEVLTESDSNSWVLTFRFCSLSSCSAVSAELSFISRDERTRKRTQHQTRS